MSDSQFKLMKVVINWVKVQKTPVPRSVLLEQLAKEGLENNTVNNLIVVLIKKKYIRRAIKTKEPSYVQVRTL